MPCFLPKLGVFSACEDIDNKGLTSDGCPTVRLVQVYAENRPESNAKDESIVSPLSGKLTTHPVVQKVEFASDDLEHDFIGNQPALGNDALRHTAYFSAAYNPLNES